MNKNRLLLLLLLFGCSDMLVAQHTQAVYTADDTLRGSITAERIWWDLSFYDLAVRVDPKTETISGQNTIRYTVLHPAQTLQVDLQPPLHIDRVVQDGQNLSFKQMGRNAFFVTLQKVQIPGAQESITIYYAGAPQKAKRAPWDGGFSWSKDKNGLPFVATSCQGLGASVWWPCKDHMYDEPDSMRITVTVPTPLMDVSNGRLRSTTDNPDSTRSFEWFVQNPINNYGVNVNIAPYSHFADTLQGEKGILSLDYYVLPENLEKARVHFLQAKQTVRAFEHWFGPYPFYEDGYKLVEVPYLGMEHQSSVTYGNNYVNGYRGIDLSGTGWGEKWDFIIIHESGHEWFANNITYKDMADMWIHESFTNYAECLYTEYYWGKAAGAAYVTGCRRLIQNRSPIIPDYNVNAQGAADMYYKGGNMLHTIRQIVDNDEKWRQILRGLNKEFYHQTVTTRQIEAYISQQAGRNLSKVFDQYLRRTDIPMLEYKFEKGWCTYRWINCAADFDMPVKVQFGNKASKFIYPTTTWQKMKTKATSLHTDTNFYIGNNIK